MASPAHLLILESVRSNHCSARERVFFKLCQKFLIVPKLCKTRFAHSPWILLINCSVTDGDPLQLQLFTEQRNPCTEGLLSVALGHLLNQSTDFSLYLEFWSGILHESPGSYIN